MRQLLSNYFYLVCFALLLVVPNVRAEQPIFDEMPRWTGGWGVQLMQEFRLHQEESHEANPSYQSAEEHIHLTHIQGVYTWDKSIRLTAKFPVVVFAEKTVEGAPGTTSSVQDQGLGDATLALPLKSYFNLDGRSGSWTFTPQLRIPMGAEDEYDVYSRQWATGASAGYATENYSYYLMTGAGAWYQFGDDPWTNHLYFHFGLNYRLGEMSGHVILKQYGKYKHNDAVTYAMGPTIYLRVTDEVHLQLQTRHDVVSWHFDDKTAREDSFRIGAAVVY